MLAAVVGVVVLLVVVMGVRVVLKIVLITVVIKEVGVVLDNIESWVGTRVVSVKAARLVVFVPFCGVGMSNRVPDRNKTIF